MDVVDAAVGIEFRVGAINECNSCFQFVCRSYLLDFTGFDAVAAGGGCRRIDYFDFSGDNDHSGANIDVRAENYRRFAGDCGLVFLDVECFGGIYAEFI